MNRILATISMTVMLAIASGCASMSAEECAYSDWSAIGYGDGARGYTSDRFSAHNKACAKHGVAADFSAYQEGREDGLREFCQPSRGYQLGENGGRYNGVCAADLEPDFLDAYRIGSHLHTLRSNVNSASSGIAVRERELEDIESSMLSKELRLIDKEATTEERIQILADLKNHSERTGELEAEIKQLYSDLARYETELRDYENTIVAYGY
jgi:hypothetical protein